MSRLAESQELKEKVMTWMFSMLSEERSRNSSHFLDLSGMP